MKLAIIGFGGMGNWHYENISERVPEIEVVGAYDIRPEIQEQIKDLDLKCYSSLEDILEDKSIDIVTIATPNNSHKDYVIKCMEHGKNVICEKPVTMNAEELEEIIKVRNKTGKLFSIHQNRRWDRDYAIIKQIQEDNTIGKFHMIENRVQGSRRAMHGWRAYKENGGGMLLDWGVHLLDQMMELVKSPVTQVYAHFFSLYSEEVDDNVKIMLKFGDGTSGLIEVSTNCFINQSRWHVTGDEGTAIIKNWECEGEIVKLDSTAPMEWSDQIVYTEAGPTRTMAPRPSETTINLELPVVKTDWTDYYKNIVAAIKGTEKLIVTPEQALRVMKVIDLIFESALKEKSKSCNI
ncbi:hypothetical protein AN639_11505 [Candidatus Epulonipiscium fishelsonii]|uniref:Uncharacterized protein n=1 Tax=Candidatus Epulonipiscium fishelsonii TaxID=77094 RepID=A0ACC8X8A1_9FIRM|nr:hypothetical protein AN396_11505 [Epulopiscium sp. SCG-B11WGA-EpuloA1]ONI43074.1 hypothetical protein AN639_11505 [Epulopiscium sp. SCG-B05WGA-EpuloA1]